MLQPKTFTTQWEGKTLTIETGRFALQADAACTVRLGDTVVLATVVMDKTPKANLDFFPLTVEFEERYYAAGKIKGSRFIKKEGRPTDEAVLAGRMIDRSIRPLFPDTLRNEVQVVITVLSFDEACDPDVLGVIAASCALHMSLIPWSGPIAGVRIGERGGDFFALPSYEEVLTGSLDLVVCGTKERVLMLEAGAKIIPDARMEEAIRFGLHSLAPVIDLIEQVRGAVGKAKYTLPTEDAAIAEARARVEALARPIVRQGIEELFFAAPLAKKTERAAAKKALAERVKATLKEQGVADEHLTFGTSMIGDELDTVISEQILEHGRRVDGRGIEDIRPLFAEVSVLPRTHGSGHFLRGETQVLSTVTLAGPSAEQIIDTMEFDKKKRYMHHYSFPPYSVGEAKPMRGPGRREIGHGALAEKALEPVIPSKETFPYVIRVVSETLTSNGSSSMASACGSTLALLDAGVPLTAPVAGVAIGLASTPTMDKWRIFTDLQDLEDGAGGMDFKVTGTSEGVTAIQLDTKSLGLTMNMVAEALRQAHAGRLKILDVIHTAIPAARTELSKHAPRIESFMIHPDKIREVIGPGGKMINEIIDKTGVEIDIEDSGLVTVTSKNVDGIAKAVEWIRSLTQDAEVGKTYKGKVVRLMEFGAFVEILPKKDGLVHVSELAPWRVGKVEDIVKLGQEVFVKLMEIDSMGRLNLSMKQAEGNVYPEHPPTASSAHGGGHGGRPMGGGRPPRAQGGSPLPPHRHSPRPQGFGASDLP